MTPRRPAPLEPATFVERPNRFVVLAARRDGTRVRAHLADPGRLRELLSPGAELRLRPAPHGAARATRWTVALVRATGHRRPWVSLEPAAANDLAARLLATGAVRGIPRPATLRREVRRGGSRVDALVEPRRGTPVWVEVKAVSLVRDGVAMFPDAPTARGRRHLHELAALTRAGGRAAVLFVVQRDDATRVEPAADIDPGFAAALADARAAGVALRAAAWRFDARGGARHAGAVPVVLPRRTTRRGPAHREHSD